MKLLKILISCLFFLVPIGGFALLPGCGVEGLHNANPATRISADGGGFTFSNNKDVSVKLESGEYDPVTKKLVLKNLEITDSASTVRNANVNQIDAMGREAVMIGQAWSSGFQAAAQLVGAFNPLSGGATVSGPFGGTLTIQAKTATTQQAASSTP
jgi:hypothetical protein